MGFRAAGQRTPIQGRRKAENTSSRVHQRDWQTGGIPFYRAREIVNLAKYGSVDNELFISEELYQSFTSKGLSPATGDIMITGVGTIGVPYVVTAEDRFYFKDASVLIFKNCYGLFSDFLRCFFQSKQWIDDIHRKSMGTTVHTLTIARANEVIIPLPPLAEQKRIVAKVDELMKRCDELEARQNERNDRHPSTFFFPLPNPSPNFAKPSSNSPSKAASSHKIQMMNRQASC